jgi:hypothetical protein
MVVVRACPRAAWRQRGGNRPTYDEGRALFERAWQDLLPELTEANFDEWRGHAALTTRKYAMRDAHLQLPTAVQSGRSTWFCDAVITEDECEKHVFTVHKDMR